MCQARAARCNFLGWRKPSMAELCHMLVASHRWPSTQNEAVANEKLNLEMCLMRLYLNSCSIMGPVATVTLRNPGDSTIMKTPSLYDGDFQDGRHRRTQRCVLCSYSATTCTEGPLPWERKLLEFSVSFASSKKQNSSGKGGALSSDALRFLCVQYSLISL